MNFELARKIADAVLYEGYVLYPYRRSSAKNRFRWQFGVVAPRAWSEQGGEAWEMQTECLIEPEGAPLVDITVRFLQVQVGSEAEWEKGIERTIDLARVSVDELLEAEECRDESRHGRQECRRHVVAQASASTVGNRADGRDIPFEIPGDPPLSILLRLQAERVDDFIKLRVRIENLTDFPNAADADRSAAMRRSMIGTHTLLGITGGAFVSLTDPAPPARAAVRFCSNVHTWPVLAGPQGASDVMLSSPIILQDHPAIAPESQGDFFDATEIDEMLTLRVMTLTDEEKREACATDDRARGIIERCDSIPPEAFERLHGAIRSLGTLPSGAGEKQDWQAAAPAPQMRNDSRSYIEHFFNPPGEEPEEASVSIGAATISRGDRVRLAPKRRADSMDFFLAGRVAVVAAVHRDVENQAYVAVTVEDDPAADIQGRAGRFLYFYPDELELVAKEK